MNMLLFSMVIAVWLVALVIAEPTVELGSAADYVILAKTGISTVPGPNSIITGDIAVSPITGAAMTGFAFTKDSSGEFSTADGQITGNAYAADFAVPTPSKLTIAVLAMQAAYTNAAGRTNPIGARTNLGGGLLGGVLPGGPKKQLTPGVYTFGTAITISGDLHFDGMCSIPCIPLLFRTNILSHLTHKNSLFHLSSGAGVYIIQVAGPLVMAGAFRVILENGAVAKDIFWQVSGSVNIGATAHMEGTILTATSATFITGSTLNGRIYTQTHVALQMAIIACPTDSTCSVNSTDDPM
jgi:hypothetical protein